MDCRLIHRLSKINASFFPFFSSFPLMSLFAVVVVADTLPSLVPRLLSLGGVNTRRF